MNMMNNVSYFSEENTSEALTRKFAAVWEKKNSKAARSGAVSLMALSLAACGGSSDTTTSGDVTTVSTDALTAGDDIISGTAGTNDNITSAKNGYLNDGDTIIDSSTSDNDTLSASFKNGDDMTGTPTITNIENVALSFDMLNGAAFDATDVDGADIQVSLLNAATDGAVTVSGNTNNNAVTAVSGVKTLTVEDSDEGLVVNAGASTTINITAVDGDADNTVSAAVNTDGGAVTLAADMSAGTTYAYTSINAAADATITVTGSDFGSGTDAVVTAAGSVGAVTLKGTDAELATADKFVNVDLTVTTTSGAQLELGTSTVGTINITDNAGAITLNDLVSGTVNVTTDENTDVTIVGKTSASSATINVSTNQATGTLSATTGSYTINTTDAVNTIGTLEVGGSSTLNTVGNTVITSFDNTGTTGDSLTITGDGNITMTDAGNNALTVTAENEGTFTFTSTNDAAHTVTGAAGVNTITLANAAETATVTTGDAADVVKFTATVAAKQVVTVAGGNDTVTIDDASALDGKTTIDLGAGDDTLKLGTAAGAAAALVDAATDVLTIKGGEGDDTLVLITGADLSQGTNATLVLDSIENITMAGAVTIDAKTLDGATFTVNGSTAGNTDDLTVTIADAADANIDLSGITVASNLESVSIDLSTLSGGIAHTLNGTTGDDDIEGSDLADVVNAGAGDDTYTANTAIATGVTVDLGAGDDTFEMIYAATGSAAVTLGAGEDTLDLTDWDTGDLSTVTVADFTSGTDTISVDVADTGYTGTYTDVITTAANATALNLGATDGAAINYIIADTAANVAGVDLSLAANAGAMLVFVTDTNKLYIDDDGDMSSGMELIATLTGVDELIAADFSIA